VSLVRLTVAQVLRSFDAWLPVRRMRMTGTVAAATAGYLAMITLQLSLVAPVPGEASTASLTRPGGLLSISISNAGVCVLPVCLLGPTCVAGVGGCCVVPLAAPPPATPAPRAPLVSAPPPAATPHLAPAPVVRAPRVAPHVTVVPAAPPPKAPPATVVVIPVDRPVAAAPVQHAPSPASSGALAAPPAVVAPRTATPGPAGSPWWLYALFVVVDLAALVALAVLIRRTAASQSSV
jgi:hypothetical protein